MAIWLKLLIKTIISLALFSPWAMADLDSPLDLGRSQWLKKMQTTLITQACAKDSHYTHCYEMSSAKCQAAFSNAGRMCSAQLRIPATINSVSQGPKVAERWARCAALRFEKHHKSLFKHNPTCLDRWRK